MASIWIDLDNAPHVPFFSPLIRSFQSNDHRVFITIRDYGYTRQLIEQRGFAYSCVGRHPGKSKVKKVLGLADRVRQLVQWSYGQHFDVAVSHGSRALVLACAIRGIPCVTLYDYEFVSTGIFNRLSKKIMLPELIPDEVIESLGLREGLVVKYPGLKEELYLGDFEPDPTLCEQLKIGKDQVLVSLRPPATSAHYHNPASEAIFQAVLDRISASEGVVGVILPRTAYQAEEMDKLLRNPLNFRILTQPVNGLNMIWNSDLVVGGGGTMNREAAMLGVPVYSLFMGKMGAIDLALAQKGRLNWIRTVADVGKITIEKRPQREMADMKRQFESKSRELCQYLSQHILDVCQPS